MQCCSNILNEEAAKHGVDVQDTQVLVTLLKFLCMTEWYTTTIKYVNLAKLFYQKAGQMRKRTSDTTSYQYL